MQNVLLIQCKMHYSTIFIKTTAMHCINKRHENDEIKNSIITTIHCCINKQSSYK